MLSLEYRFSHQKTACTGISSFKAVSEEKKKHKPGRQPDGVSNSPSGYTVG